MIYSICLSLSLLDVLISTSIHVAEMALFHFYDWVTFHYAFYDMWTLDSGLTDVTHRPGSMNVLSRRNLPDGLGLLEEIIWPGAFLDHVNRTSHCPLNLPRWTAPNGPLPSSFNTVISSLCSSQIPNNARQEHFRLRIEDFGAKSLESDFLSNENLTPARWSTAQLFKKLLS